MKDHTIYLKALTKGKPKSLDTEIFKMDLELLAKEFIPVVKPRNPIDEEKAGRKFILENLEEFLNYSVEFSLADRINNHSFK